MINGYTYLPIKTKKTAGQKVENNLELKLEIKQLRREIVEIKVLLAQLLEALQTGNVVIPVEPPVEPPIEPPVEPPTEPPVEPPTEPPPEPPTEPPVEPITISDLTEFYLALNLWMLK